MGFFFGGGDILLNYFIFRQGCGATEHIGPAYFRIVSCHWQTVAKLPPESVVTHINLNCPVRTANVQAVAPPSPLGCPCQNAGSGIVLLISLRKDCVMGRPRDKEQKELTDC